MRYRSRRDPHITINAEKRDDDRGGCMFWTVPGLRGGEETLTCPTDVWDQGWEPDVDSEELLDTNNSLRAERNKLADEVKFLQKEYGNLSEYARKIERQNDYLQAKIYYVEDEAAEQEDEVKFLQKQYADLGERRRELERQNAVLEGAIKLLQDEAVEKEEAMKTETRT